MINNNLQQKEKAKKLLLLLPLLVVPFMTVLFWAMGGGSAIHTGNENTKGFNSKLPAAHFKEDKTMDKLKYYDQASLDSTRLDEMRKKDPNYRFAAEDSVNADTSDKAKGLQINQYQSPQEEKVYRRLEELRHAINQPAASNPKPRTGIAGVPAADVARNEAGTDPIIRDLETTSQPDPEMAQISGMLETILDLQYPERMEQKLKEESAKNRGRTYPVGTLQEHNVVGSLPNPAMVQSGTSGGGGQQSGFFGLEQQEYAVKDNAISAVIAETQSVVNGATVKMALAQDIYINGHKIPENTYVYGTAALKGERLAVEITTVRHGNSIYPVELTVYDLDGLTGICIPGAINRDVAKSSADRSVQTLGVTTLNDSWGAQAAGAGIEAAKGLFSRKVKLVKVTLKAGYAVLLKDEKKNK